MTEIQKINAAAKAEFDKGNYPLAFQTLWKVGVSHFISYSQREEKKTSKTNWLADSNSANFFWSEFLLDESIFKILFESNSAEQLLHNYFSKSKIQEQALETKLAKEFPETFIKSIRVNQVFLNPDRIETLKAIPFKKEFQLHQKVWQKIYEIENDQWNGIQNELQSVLKLSLEDILSHCIIWLETNRFTDSSRQNIHHLASVYSFFIELVLTNQDTKTFSSKSEDDFFKHFLEVFTANFKNKEIIENSIVSKLLFRISNWLNFKEYVISPYSFDLNIEPIQENELVFFNSTPQAYYKWILNGVRYEVNQLNYIFQGSELVEYLEKENRMKIPGKTEHDIQRNRNLASLKWGTLLLLDDLACETFTIGNTKIESEKLLSPLLTYSFNRLGRYENSLKKHFESSQNWSEAFMKIIFQSIATDIRREPYFIMTENDYGKLNQEALSQLPEVSTNEVIQLFSFNPNKKYEFNRFRYTYGVWQKPFMKIGDFLFCPMMFFASNIWFYSFSQAALFQKTEKSETEKMEKHFGELIEQKGWKVKVISDAESSQMDKGDVDIFVEDGETILFIQLKRTYFRLNLKDAYYESCKTDSKAAKQLNEAEKYLSQPNTIYNFKHQPHKWIVSTSFENVGEKINGCRKVNYFEFLNTLKNPEMKKLKDLITELEADKNLKLLLGTAYNNDLPIEVRKLVSEVAKPLATFESKQYKQFIFSDDENRTREYNSIFDNGIKLDNDNKKNEALVQFQKCISLNPNDADAYGAVANILADMKIFESSFIAFKRALELLPNDPYITRNYCLALIESGYWYEGLSKAIGLYEMFPMLGDIRILFEKSYKQCLKYGLLNSEQLIKLKEKWDEMI
jgi:hypothetical protein